MAAATQRGPPQDRPIAQLFRAARKALLEEEEEPPPPRQKDKTGKEGSSELWAAAFVKRLAQKAVAVRIKLAPGAFAVLPASNAAAAIPAEAYDEAIEFLENTLEAFGPPDPCDPAWQQPYTEDHWAFADNFADAMPPHGPSPNP